MKKQIGFISSKFPEGFTFKLEELRISNNQMYDLGYEDIADIYPNLIKLYAGGTLTSLNDFKCIIKSLQKLEILDLTNCNLSYESNNVGIEDIDHLLKNCRLKVIFSTTVDLILIELITKHKIELINESIGKILCNIKHKDLKEFEI